MPKKTSLVCHLSLILLPTNVQLTSLGVAKSAPKLKKNDLNRTLTFLPLENALVIPARRKQVLAICAPLDIDDMLAMSLEDL
jgi:hypothetical protein